MENIILYGAGVNGKEIYSFLKYQHLEGIVDGFCDKNAKNICLIDDKPVFLYKELINKNKLFIITVSREDIRKEIKRILLENGERFYESIEDWAINNNYDRICWNRNYIAWFHEFRMDRYYEQAEKELETFWGKNSIFRKLFEELNLEEVIELAVGHGRHVPMYMNKAQKIMLVDILQKNIDICKMRFDGNDKISYYCNDGFNLRKIEDCSYTSLFSYDSMVHFELLDIYSYLKEIFRVLKQGGCALIHHSNNTSSFKNDFSNTSHRRNYMSKEIFAYLSYRCGFKIIEQKCMSWGNIPNLDCVTLLKKE